MWHSINRICLWFHLIWKIYSVRRGHESMQVTLSVYVSDTWINHEWAKPNGHRPRSDEVLLGMPFFSVCVLHLPIDAWRESGVEVEGLVGWWANCFWAEGYKILLGCNHKSYRTEENQHPLVFHNCPLVYGPKKTGRHSKIYRPGSTNQGALKCYTCS